MRAALDKTERSWGEPSATYVAPDVVAREEAKRRHPAGRALTGLFTQTHPWLAPAEPAEPFERRPELADRVEALEERVAELETRLAQLEDDRGDGGEVIEAVTFDGQTTEVRVPAGPV
ncbi:hypothetical protein ACWCSD_34425 [Nonomuraea sp. NPDC001684]